MASSGALASQGSGGKDGLRRLVAKTGSMLPAIPIDAILVVDTDWYQTHPVARFDIVSVVRSTPLGAKHQPVANQVVARVIALGGETVALQDNTVYIDGRPLDEPMRTLPCTEIEGSLSCGTMTPLRVPAGEIFLLADNRGGSEDSRLWQPQTIAAAAIVGKVTDIVPPVRPPPN